MMMVSIFELAFNVLVGDKFTITDGNNEFDCLLTENGLLVKIGGGAYTKCNKILEDSILRGSFKKKED